MQNLQRTLSLLILLLIGPAVNAEQSAEQDIKKSITTARPDLVVNDVKKSTMPGLYEVQILNGPTLYSSPDGAYFIAGDLFAVRSEGIVNLAEEQRGKDRVAALAKVKPNDMVIFKAARKTKAVVSVFTDIDCGYCQKLHQEVPELNRMGIEVRYLAYPRAGVGSPSYDKLVTAWCADDSNTVLTKLKNREQVPAQSCAGNAVASQFKLGQQLGVTGTPSLITEDGKMLPGYLPATELAKALGVTPG